MTTTTLVSILIGVAVAALLVVRQLRAQRRPASHDRTGSLTSHRF